jgi:RNase P subunit RPR2
MSQKLPIKIEEKLRERICKKCDFYKEGEILECHAFKVSKKLVEEGKVDLEDL